MHVTEESAQYGASFSTASAFRDALQFAPADRLIGYMQDLIRDENADPAVIQLVLAEVQKRLTAAQKNPSHQ